MSRQLMASMASNFHATTEEIVTFVEAMVAAHKLSVAASYFPPERIELVDALREAVQRPKFRELFLSPEPFLEVPSDSQTRVFDANAPVLTIRIGQLTEEGLRESWMATLLVTPVWKQVVRAYKKMTRAGMSITVDGKAHVYRDHRSSEGARRLHRQGVVMLSFTRKHHLSFPRFPTDG